MFKILYKKGYPKEKITARFGGCEEILSGEKVDDIDVATILTTNEMKGLKTQSIKLLIAVLNMEP